MHACHSEARSAEESAVRGHGNCEKQIPRFARDDMRFARDDMRFARDDMRFARDDSRVARSDMLARS
jgi:hypothetical protein